MIDTRAADAILNQGFYLTGLPCLPSGNLEVGFRQFMKRDRSYRNTFAQVRYQTVFDGYSALGQEDSSNQGAEDLVFSFVLSNFQDTRVFPEEFQPFLAADWPATLAVIRALEIGLIRALSIPGLDALYEHHLGHMISCNYYPPLEELGDFHVGKKRLGPHNDISLFTVFPFGLAEGLEYQDQQGRWVSMPACDSMLIFPGYLLEYWSLGKIKAFNHRLALPQEQQAERTSFAFFSLPKPGQAFALMDPTRIQTSDRYFEMYLAQFN